MLTIRTPRGGLIQAVNGTSGRGDGCIVVRVWAGMKMVGLCPSDAVNLASNRPSAQEFIPEIHDESPERVISHGDFFRFYRDANIDHQPTTC